MIKDKRQEFPWFVEQTYFPGCRPQLEVISAKESQLRGYGLTGYHKENNIDPQGRGFYTVHVTGVRTEKEGHDFKNLVDRG